jgi:hypothetical protein
MICSALDYVADRQIDRLMIFTPPQHGKSQLTSINFPAYWLGRFPDDPVIITSYGASLAENKSRHARVVVESDEFARLFPKVQTNPASRAVDRWELRAPNRGGVLAAGAGGPLTGTGAKCGIIDDPIESWAQAQSLTWRDRTWDWYRGTFRTRIWEGGVIVLIMTRWHEDDLAGRLLLREPGRWAVLRLPALAETQEVRDYIDGKMGLETSQPDPIGRAPGEALCPGRFSVAALDDLRKSVGDLVWSAEYQGAPTRPEGNRFKRWMFPIVDAPPAEFKTVRYWDTAGTEEGGAFTVGLLLAKDLYRRRLCVLSVVRGQWDAFQRKTIMRQVADYDAREYPGTETYIEQEPGDAGKESVLDTIKELDGYTVRPDRVTGDKDVRLEPYLSQCQASNVSLLSGSWNEDYIDEMCAVPNGVYRDQADASAGAHNKLALGFEQAQGLSPLAGYRG